MSTIAQRKDIYDADVIDAFAQEVGEQIFLDYLYLLTIADMRGTDPKIFNGWKETLLSDLYTATRRHLANSGNLKKDSSERAADMRKSASKRLTAEGIEISAAESLWTAFDEQYFLRHRVEEIAWHAKNILTNFKAGQPLVCVENFADRSATAIFIYTVDSANLFARTTAALDKLQLDIQDARISTSAKGYTLDTYIVLDSNTAGPISDPIKVDKIISKVTAALSTDEVPLPSLTRDATRVLKTFAVPTIVDFEYDEAHNYTIMGVNTLDQPGLLSILGEVMRKYNVQLFDARIATIGERAEDYFCITLDEANDLRGRKRDIPPKLQREIRTAIVTAIEAR